MQTELLCDGMQYLSKHIIMIAWVKTEDSILYNNTNEFPIWESPTFVNSMIHFLHITKHILQKIMTHNLKKVASDILSFSIHTIFLWPYILDAKSVHK
jgi:hypothetical protein